MGPPLRRVAWESLDQALTPRCSSCGYAVDLVRSCYRSYWRLHDDQTILTPGRYYFCGDAPFAPFPTLRGSRNWDEEDQPAKRVREWGEWDGKQEWDAGEPPDDVPLPRLVGSRDCISDPAYGPDGFPETSSSSDVRTVCIGGIVYSFPSIIYVNYSVGYAGLRWTYYDNVELYLIEADCEARYEGDARIPNTKAIVRVTEGPGGTLHTNFYLCETGEPPPPPIVTDCCDNPVPAVITQTYRVYGSFPAGPFNQTWAIELENISMVYYEHPPAAVGGDDFPAWYAFLDASDQPTTPEACVYIVRKACWIPTIGVWLNQFYTPGGFNSFAWESLAPDFDCATGRAEYGLAALPTTYGSGNINGHLFDATFGDYLWVEME